jgi:hypothetical protein
VSHEETLELLDTDGISLVEMVDNLLNRGVVLTGEVFIGLAGVDLIYLQLSAVLCSADRILRHERPEEKE